MTTEKALHSARDIVKEHETGPLPHFKENLEGETCTVCGGDQFETRAVDADCTVEEYETVCRWGYSITARVLVVEIPWVYGVKEKTQFLEAHCENHGEEVEFSARKLRSETDPVSDSTFQIETEAVVEPHPIHQHHVSYEPEKTIPVCSSCHGKIHHTPDFRPDLEPDMSRSEADLLES